MRQENTKYPILLTYKHIEQKSSEYYIWLETIQKIDVKFKTAYFGGYIYTTFYFIAASVRLYWFGHS